MTASVSKPAEDLVGRVLGERYRVEQRLSQGGMGVVYQARHVVLDSQLAVKVLLKPQGPEDQRRFLQEAKLASLIQHPNTVQIIDFGVLPSGQSYLVMELMRGRTLATELQKGPMDALRVCQIGTQIARGLQAVHDQGIVHRERLLSLKSVGETRILEVARKKRRKADGCRNSLRSGATKRWRRPGCPRLRAGTSSASSIYWHPGNEVTYLIL